MDIGFDAWIPNSIQKTHNIFVYSLNSTLSRDGMFLFASHSAKPTNQLQTMIIICRATPHYHSIFLPGYFAMLCSLMQMDTDGMDKDISLRINAVV